MPRRQPTQMIRATTSASRIQDEQLDKLDKAIIEANLNDSLYGGNKADRLVGGDTSDYLHGDDGKDTLKGSSGDDYLFGDNGSDRIFGGADNDELWGDNGKDYLNGFGGGLEEVDSLTGGLGADTFVIGDSAGVDYQSGSSKDTQDLSYAIIKDFSAGEDLIQAAGSASDYELVFDEFSSSKGVDTGIYLGDDLIAVVDDTTDVTFASDFVFV